MQGRRPRRRRLSGGRRPSRSVHSAWSTCCGLCVFVDDEPPEASDVARLSTSEVSALTSTLTPPTGGLPAPLSLSSAADEDDLLDQPDPVWDTPMDRGNAELLDALRQRRQRIANDDAPPTPPPTAPMLHRHPLMFGGLSRSRTPETNPSDDLFDSDSDSEDW